MKKKNRIWIYLLILIEFVLIFTISCKKNDDKPIKTKRLPVLTTSSVTNITQTKATCGGYISSNGGLDVTVRGICWSQDTTPAITNSKTNNGEGSGVFKSYLDSLTPNTKYYVRAYATNGDGTSYGNQVSFTTTQSTVPIITTIPVSSITKTTAYCGGNITSDGGSTVTTRGVCWSTEQTPTIADSKTTDGNDTSSFTSVITGLTANTGYYVCAYATNSTGTGYGDALSFTTLPLNGGIVTDIDGNVYHTVTIGTQVWLVENLKTTKYRNGDLIPNVTDTTWGILKTGAYCNIENDTNNSATYGKLYNWFAVNDSRNIAPIGWHVPTIDEWTTLITYLGGESIAGCKLKETGTIHWQSPNTGATNETGFTARPAGSRSGFINCLFYGFHYKAFWWSTTDSGSNMAGIWIITYDSCLSFRSNTEKDDGCSIRCVRD